MGIDENIKKADFKGAFTTAMLTAMAFVAGLFWNDAIRSAIETVIPPSDKLGAKFIAAVIVTVMVVIIGYIMIKTQELGSKYSKNLDQAVKKQREDFELVMKKQKEQIALQQKKVREQQRRLKKELEKGIR